MSIESPEARRSTRPSSRTDTSRNKERQGKTAEQPSSLTDVSLQAARQSRAVRLARRRRPAGKSPGWLAAELLDTSTGLRQPLLPGLET
jgi:hypothetical protein